MVAPIRIAYLVGEYPAISHTFILREVLALRKLGLEVLTCSVRKPGPEHCRGRNERIEAENTFYIVEAGKNVLTLARAFGWALSRPGRLWRTIRLAAKTRPPGIRATLWQIFYLIEAMILARHLTRHKITRIHNHFATASCTVAMLTAELAGIAFSFTLHGPVDFLNTEQWCLTDKLSRARFVACISHFCRSQAMLFSDPGSWSRFHIIHCGIIPEHYDAPADPRTTRNILFTGRLAPEKGIPVLLDGFAALRRKWPDARLTLIGDGPARHALEQQAQDLGVRDITRFAGSMTQEEVAGELAKADFFVLPSFSEGLPVVLMEAMAAALPVLTTGIAGIPELVEDGVSGRVVFPGDHGAFQTALAELLSDPERMRQMGRNGREKVTAEFDSRREAQKLADLFRLPAGDSSQAPQTISKAD